MIDMRNFPYRIQVQYSSEDECYIARVPAFPLLAVHGATLDEAEAEARIAARAMVASLRARGKMVPESDLPISV